jgi:hypothetical protein
MEINMWSLVDNRFTGGTNEVVARIVKYADGNPGLRLTSFTTGEPWCVASVNLTPEQWGPLYKDRYQYMAIKNWSEGEGMDELLISAGIINGVPVRSVSSGFVDIPIYALSCEAIDEVRRVLNER